MNHADAGSRGANHNLRVSEDLHEPTDQGNRLALIARVIVHLSAAGLFQGEVDGMPEPFEQFDDGLTGSGKERIVVASDEEGNPHAIRRPENIEASARRDPWARATVTRGLIIIEPSGPGIPPTRWKTLATDYDGTLAAQGRVLDSTIGALERFRESGRTIVLVTGRELPELLEVFPRLDLFDRVVAENGGLLFRPTDRSERLLAGPPPEDFISALRAGGAEPVSVGRVVVATWRPLEVLAHRLIDQMELDLQVIMNKRAVMILPRGVDKGTGLAEALGELGTGDSEAVGVGDAENDLAFLERCGLRVAVSNALPLVKARVDLVTVASQGAGVVELIERLSLGQDGSRADHDETERGY